MYPTKKSAEKSANKPTDGHDTNKVVGELCFETLGHGLSLAEEALDHHVITPLEQLPGVGRLTGARPMLSAPLLATEFAGNCLKASNRGDPHPVQTGILQTGAGQLLSYALPISAPAKIGIAIAKPVGEFIENHADDIKNDADAIFTDSSNPIHLIARQQAREEAENRRFIGQALQAPAWALEKATNVITSGANYVIDTLRAAPAPEKPKSPHSLFDSPMGGLDLTTSSAKISSVLHAAEPSSLRSASNLSSTSATSNVDFSRIDPSSLSLAPAQHTVKISPVIAGSALGLGAATQIGGIAVGAQATTTGASLTASIPIAGSLAPVVPIAVGIAATTIGAVLVYDKLKYPYHHVKPMSSNQLNGVTQQYESDHSIQLSAEETGRMQFLTRNIDRLQKEGKNDANRCIRNESGWRLGFGHTKRARGIQNEHRSELEKNRLELSSLKSAIEKRYQGP